MCGSDLFDFSKKVTKIVVDPFGSAGVNTRPIQRGFQEAPTIRFPRFPKLDVNNEAANAAAQHQKDLIAAAFGLSDTKLTGQQGLGSVPKSLLAPKGTLGGY